MKKYILLFGLLACFSFGRSQNVLTLLSTYNLPSDTVVNAATAVLSVRSPGARQTTTVQVVVTKISGTVGGTLTLMGSVDGTNYKAITLPEVATALNTFTATDVASQNFIWRVQNSPYLYYRVSYLGVTGPMSASFTAKLLAH